MRDNGIELLLDIDIWKSFWRDIVQGNNLLGIVTIVRLLQQ